MLNSISRAESEVSLLDKLISHCKSLSLPLNEEILRKLDFLEIQELRVDLVNLKFEMQRMQEIVWHQTINFKSMSNDYENRNRFRVLDEDYPMKSLNNPHVKNAGIAQHKLTQITTLLARIKITSIRIDRVMSKGLLI